MKKMLQKLEALFNTSKPRRTRNARKSKGQSLVEFAIAFPIVIMLFAGVVEFGFILNYYLSLLDSTRETARFFSNLDPFTDATYYADAAGFLKVRLEPTNVNDTTRKIILDPAKDDVIITVYSVCGSKVVSFPSASGYHLYGHGTSIFTDASMAASRLSGAPNEGILVVQVNYNYHQVLALPWITAFLSNPLPLRAYSIMPVAAAEPPLAGPAPIPVVTCP
jgi:hypothetical protein